jgi:hypothetical protein
MVLFNTLDTKLQQLITIFNGIILTKNGFLYLTNLNNNNKNDYYMLKKHIKNYLSVDTISLFNKNISDLPQDATIYLQLSDKFYAILSYHKLLTKRIYEFKLVHTNSISFLLKFYIYQFFQIEQPDYLQQLFTQEVNLDQYLYICEKYTTHTNFKITLNCNNYFINKKTYQNYFAFNFFTLSTIKENLKKFMALLQMQYMNICANETMIFNNIVIIMKMMNKSDEQIQTRINNSENGLELFKQVLDEYFAFISKSVCEEIGINDIDQLIYVKIGNQSMNIKEYEKFKNQQ